MAITSSQKAATKAREALVLAKTELEKCNETKEAKLEEIKTLEVEALSVMQAFEKVKQSEASKRKELESVTKEVENLKKSR